MFSIVSINFPITINILADPAIANGNIFFKMGGRMVDFYCDTDYVMVPDNPVRGRERERKCVCVYVRERDGRKTTKTGVKGSFQGSWGSDCL